MRPASPASLIFVRGRSQLLLCRTPVQFKPVRFCSVAPTDASHAITSTRDHHPTAHGDAAAFFQRHEKKMVLFLPAGSTKEAHHLPGAEPCFYKVPKSFLGKLVGRTSAEQLQSSRQLCVSSEALPIQIGDKLMQPPR